MYHDEDRHWLDIEYDRYLERGEFCHCNLPAHKCTCDRLTFSEFQDVELRHLEEYLCPTF